MLFEGFLIKAAEKIDGIEIFAAAELVRNPLTLFAGIVEIQHGCNCIYTETVYVIFVEPEHGAGHEEAAHFGASVIEDVGLPLRMESLARVGVLIEVGAVEVGKAVCIGGKMGRNPVQNHGDAVLVQVV